MRKMQEKHEEPDLVGQMAGIIAMMSALVKVLPQSTRKRLLLQIQVEFESLLAAMSAAGASGGQAERESVEWLRDLFLRRIERADAKPQRRRLRKAPGMTAPASDPGTSRQPVSTDVDFEL